MTNNLPKTITASTLASSVILATYLPTIVQADQDTTIPQIVVTANRTAKTVDETIVPISIITREDIEKTQATSVIEVLRTTPGMSFTNNGGFGSTSGISLRGTNTDHVLYLIDGVPVSSATSGTTSIEYLPISQIERIEVVRGPRSSLYGSDAIGGVIQIFTSRATEKKITASVGYGSDNTREVTASYADGNETSQFSAGLSVFDTDGYDFYGRDSYGNANEYDEDDDGFKNYALSLNGSHEINQDLKLSGFYLRSQGESEFDGYMDKSTHANFTEQVASGLLDYSVTEDWNTQIKISRSYDKQYNELYKPPAKGFFFVDPKTKFNTRTDVLNWQNDIIIGDTDLLTLGFEYKNDEVESSTDFAEDSRWNKAFYSQYLYYGDVFDTQFSWRYDDNESFGSHNTWSVGTGFSLDEHVRLTTSYGTAFKAPSFNDLYWPADAFFKGNPDLKPEESESFDFGVEITTGQTMWTAHYFNTKIDNLISYVNSFPAISMMENVDEASIDGFELTLATEIYGWQLNANASFIDPVDKSTGLMLARRSKRNLNVAIDKSSGSLSYGASVIASSRRYDKTSEREELSGFGLMNIRAAWQLDKHWTVKAKIDNLFDKQYVLSEQAGFKFNQPDRFVFTSIHYEM